MRLFGCRGCEARDKEIGHLLAQLNAQRDHTTKLAAQLCEIASPGSTRRADPPPPKPATVVETKEKARAKDEDRYAFPGYERYADEAVPEIG